MGNAIAQRALTAYTLTSVVRLEDYGGAGDGVYVSDAATTAGSAVVNAPSGPFTRDMVGKMAVVASAQLDLASRLITTVLSYQSATQITLAAVVPAAQAATGMMIGTDNGPAMLAVLNAISVVSAGSRVRDIRLGDGKYILATGSQKNFLNLIETVIIRGTGRSSQLLIAGTSGMEMIVVQNLERFIFENCLIVGLFNQPFDCATVLYGQYVRKFSVHNTWWFGVGSAGGSPANGLIHTYECDTHIADSVWHGCDGKLSGNACAIFTRNWQGFVGDRILFIDYGNYEGTPIASAGTRAWIRAQDPRIVGGADGQGEFTLNHFRMDEATLYSLEFVASSTRAENVNLRDGSIFAGPDGTIAALDIASAANVDIDGVKIGFRTGGTSDAVKLTDAGNVLIRRCRFSSPVNRITVDNLTTLQLEDTVYGSVSGTPAGLTEKIAGSWVNGREPYYKTPNGTRKRLTVANDGTISTATA